MPPSNNEDLQAVRITEAGSFERISLDRNKVLDSLYRVAQTTSGSRGATVPKRHSTLDR